MTVCEYFSFSSHFSLTKQNIYIGWVKSYIIGKENCIKTFTIMLSTEQTLTKVRCKAALTFQPFNAWVTSD